MNSRNKRLRTPQGAESVYQEEAYRNRQLVRMTEDHFASWGYLPVLTPIFDYYETYRSLMDGAQEERVYRFPDRDGELLMLRSDITLFLAKQMGLSSSSSPSPRRVYYADSILRHQNDEDISSDEFFQSGAELIGLANREADLEVLMLLHDLLETMRLPAWRMHIGSLAILDAVLERRNNLSAAGALLELRDLEGLDELLREMELDKPTHRRDLLLFLGSPDEFASEAPKLAAEIGPAAEAAVGALMDLSSALLETASMDRIHIDLSEHGGQPYYTGFTVQAYVEGANSAVASGGRYDNLLGNFGHPAPAAGFSLMMRKLEPLSGFAADAAGHEPIILSRGKGFAERYRNASQQRKEGQRVRLSGGSGGLR